MHKFMRLLIAMLFVATGPSAIYFSPPLDWIAPRFLILASVSLGYFLGDRKSESKSYGALGEILNLLMMLSGAILMYFVFFASEKTDYYSEFIIGSSITTGIMWLSSEFFSKKKV